MGLSRKEWLVMAFTLACLSACTKADEPTPIAKAPGSDQERAHRAGLDNASAMIRYAEECEPFLGEGSVDACQRACGLNHSNSCANWAAGVQEQSPRKAKELYERACTGGSGIGCEGLARVAARSQGDEEAAVHYLGARRYHRVHCAQGYARSCSQLAALLDQGLGGNTDFKTGAMYRERACRLGRIESCPSESTIPTSP